MADSKPSSTRTIEWEEWLRLQQRLVRRTSEYLQGLGELVGQGSLEPREYIEQSAKAWAAVVGDVGDWIKPGSDVPLDNSQALVSYVTAGLSRGGSRAIKIEVPAHLFHPRDQDVVVRLTTDGLIRRFDPRSLARPALVLEPERHLRLALTSEASGPTAGAGGILQEREGLDVSRDQRSFVELKVYDLPDTINANEVYEGVVWGEVLGREQRVPVAVVALTIE